MAIYVVAAAVDFSFENSNLNGMFSMAARVRRGTGACELLDRKRFSVTLKLVQGNSGFTMPWRGCYPVE
jgi:hypothetical protein